MAGKFGNWGGARENAGAKSKWRTEGGTKLVRVPVAIESEVLEAARAIDAGQRLVLQQENVTKSSYNENATESSQFLQQETVTNSSQMVAQLEAELDQAKLERDKLREQLNDQAKRAGEWYDKAKEAQGERDELAELNHALTLELDKLKTQAEISQPLPDLETIRDRFLSGLRLGKQAPEYKRTKAAIDRFITEIRTEQKS